MTHLMEPCLSGQGKTLMVVNVGPEADNAQETLCSLRFASQVNQCDVGGKPVKSAKPMDGAGGAPAKAAAGGAPAKRPASGAPASRPATAGAKQPARPGTAPPSKRAK